MGIHRIRADTHRALGGQAFREDALRQHEVTHHAPRFANIKGVGPVVVVGEFVVGQAPLGVRSANGLRHARTVLQRPEQAELPIPVRQGDLVPRGVVGVRIVVVHSDVVRGNAVFIIGIGLAIRQQAQLKEVTILLLFDGTKE